MSKIASNVSNTVVKANEVDIHLVVPTRLTARICLCEYICDGFCLYKSALFLLQYIYECVQLFQIICKINKFYFKIFKKIIKNVCYNIKNYNYLK